MLDDLDFIIDEEEPEFLLVTNPPSFKLNDELQEALKDVVEEKSFNWND
jgi:hypothetical protein